MFSFIKRATPCQSLTPLPAGYERLQRDYADLCAFSVKPKMFEQRHRQGCADFPILCSLPFIRHIGVNPVNHTLVIGTACAYLRKTANDPWRMIGDFVVQLYKRPSGFICHNMIQMVNGYQHPHVDEHGSMCIIGKQEINLLIADGDFVEAVKIIWSALNTTNGAAYVNAAAEMWPIWKEETR